MEERTEETMFTAELEAVATTARWILVPTETGDAVILAESVEYVASRTDGKAFITLRDSYGGRLIKTSATVDTIHRLLCGNQSAAEAVAPDAFEETPTPEAPEGYAANNFDTLDWLLVPTADGHVLFRGEDLIEVGDLERGGALIWLHNERSGLQHSVATPLAALAVYRLLIGVPL